MRRCSPAMRQQLLALVASRRAYLWAPPRGDALLGRCHHTCLDCIERSAGECRAGGLLDDVEEWLLQRADLWDLTRSASPCTSSIGSAKVAGALQDLGALHGLAGLRVWRLLGLSDKEDPAEHPVRPGAPARPRVGRAARPHAPRASARLAACAGKEKHLHPAPAECCSRRALGMPSPLAACVSCLCAGRHRKTG